MRAFAVLLVCLATGACSPVSDPAPFLDAGQPPNPTQLTAGLAAGVRDSHFGPPIEVTDVYRAPPSSTPPWMACVRSGSSDEARRFTYSVFYGKDGSYVQSRPSVYMDSCLQQPYHSYQ